MILELITELPFPTGINLGLQFPTPEIQKSFLINYGITVTDFFFRAKIKHRKR